MSDLLFHWYIGKEYIQVLKFVFNIKKSCLRCFFRAKNGMFYFWLDCKSVFIKDIC